MFTPGPISLIDGTSTTAEVIIYDQYKQPMTAPAGTAVTYSIDNAAVATSTPNADGVTDAIVAVGLGVANLSASVTIPGLSTALTNSESITVTAAPSVATSVEIAFGSN